MPFLFFLLLFPFFFFLKRWKDMLIETKLHEMVKSICLFRWKTMYALGRSKYVYVIQQTRRYVCYTLLCEARGRNDCEGYVINNRRSGSVNGWWWVKRSACPSLTRWSEIYGTLKLLVKCLCPWTEHWERGESLLRDCPGRRAIRMNIMTWRWTGGI